MIESWVAASIVAMFANVAKVLLVKTRCRTALCISTVIDRIAIAVASNGAMVFSAWWNLVTVTAVA
jgi:hypothetical protein